VSEITEFRHELDRVAFARSVGLEADPWQIDLLRSESPRVLINASRQSGKSTITALLALHKALYTPGSLVLLLAPALRQSQELFAKLSEFYGVLGEPMRLFGERRLSLELSNGSRVVTLPGHERTIRGYSGVALLVVDEAARIKDELVYAVRPMLAVSGGSMLLLSTPFGRRGVFYQEWTEGLGWEKYEVPASAVPRISADFLAEERAALPRRIYEQEYLCRFVELEDSVFAYDDVMAMADSNVTPLFAEVG